MLERKATFTTCGATGRRGPTQPACLQEYGSAHPLEAVEDGIQTFTIPAGGFYRVHLLGAAGGCGNDNPLHQPGGSGASVTAVLELEAGTELSVVVGQSGDSYPDGSRSSYRAGAGGGGTFLFIAGSDIVGDMLLAAAGGGGGASYASGDPRYYGNDGRHLQRGGDATSPGSTVGDGGEPGQGGDVANSYDRNSGGSGGGWDSPGRANYKPHRGGGSRHQESRGSTLTVDLRSTDTTPQCATTERARVAVAAVAANPECASRAFRGEGGKINRAGKGPRKGGAPERGGTAEAS